MDYPNVAVYLNNPIELQKLLYKLIRIQGSDKRIREGWVTTVDPVSESIVLVSFEDDCPNKVEIVLGHAVIAVEVLSEEDVYVQKLKDLWISTDKKTHSISELATRKDTVMSWLLKNRFPVTENSDSSLTVAGALTIIPPYGHENCLCSNEIILNRIQDLLNSLPS